MVADCQLPSTFSALKTQGMVPISKRFFLSPVRITRGRQIAYISLIFSIIQGHKTPKGQSLDNMKQESNNWIFRQLEKQTSYQVFSVPYGSYVKNTQNKYQTATVERNKPSINGCQSREVTSADHKVLAHQLLTHINSFVACWALSRHIGVSCFQNQTDLRCWTKKSKDRLTFLFPVNTCLQEGAERFKYMYMCIN